MNREIKFRGKRIDNGEWVYGYYVADIEWAKYYMYYPKKNGAFISLFRVEIDTETVGQHTGLKDKNGKEIYERDIVNCYDNGAKNTEWHLDKEHLGTIIFASPAFVLNIPGKLIYDGGAVKQWANDIVLTHWCNAENIEVIGNIHDNPDLSKPDACPEP